MNFSLSGRLVEIEYDHCELNNSEFVELAASCGYDAVELRPTQIPEAMSPGDAASLSSMCDSAGVTVSAVLLPDELSSERPKGELAERLRRYVELIDTLGCVVVKSWFNDVSIVGDICDLVYPLGMSVISQIHANGPLESVSSSLETIRALGRRNFGLQYDATNLFELGEEYSGEAVKTLGSAIHQISVQNCAPVEKDASPGAAREATGRAVGAWESGGRWFRRCLIGDSKGVDFDAVFRALASIGFDGCVVVNEPKSAILETEDFACHTIRALREIVIQ